MNKTCNLIVLLCAITICVSFFLPWVGVESKMAGGISRLIGGKGYVSLKTISGFQVPILANGPDAKLMISIVKLFNPASADIHKRSWLIWMVPGLAVIMALLILSLEKNRWVNLSAGVMGVAIFSLAAFQILKADLDKVILQVAVLPGLWITLWSYMGIGLVGIFRFYLQRPPRSRRGARR
ncbi:MAG: hypothetical protein PHW98_00190 [Candidatus Omnitrophica bacterium]|nr:hypothetical protein [Candidatus Omnitrophota bacterium]MDD5770665.1 hypothetical protein [Candidatus Omnitrophota bacterium]